MSIHVVNIEKYQPTYKDGRRLLWIRWDLDSYRDYKISKLTPEQKWLFIGLIGLEVSNQGPIPNDEKWVADTLGFRNNHIHKHIQMLQTLGLVVTNSHNECESSCLTDRHTDNTDRQTECAISPFETLWKAYPKPVGKKDALRHYQATVKTEEDAAAIIKALENYKRSERVLKGFVQNGSTWFNQWRDWVDFNEQVCPKCKGKGKYTSPTGYECKCECPAGSRV